MTTLKVTVEDLAILGGAPTFDVPLHVGRPNIGDRQRFQEYVNDILDRRWLTNEGRYATQFEQRVAQVTGVEHCVAVCNGTLALQIAMKALGLHGEVIIPSFTFIATAHALRWNGITPVFCDIEPNTHNIDPIKVEQLITPRTTGIVGVHVWGRPCNIDALVDIAEQRGLKLLFDAAPGFGCSYKKRMLGGFGHAEVFSFHATKVVNCLEGGAVVTNDGDLARRLRLMRNFGFTDYDRTNDLGINGKMNEISAAMGLTNLQSLDEFVQANYRNYEQYRRDLAGVPGISVMTYDEEERNNFQYVVLEIDDRETSITRDQLVKILHAENVLARRYFYPGCHRMEPYRSDFARGGMALPETERLGDRVLCLPTGTSIGSKAIAGISEILRFAIANSEQLRGRSERTTRSATL